MPTQAGGSPPDVRLTSGVFIPIVSPTRPEVETGMNDLRAQLSPGWSGVNIAITVVLFLIAWPLALLMVGYIVWGQRIGLDFARPETISHVGRRLSGAWRAGTGSWSRDATLSTGTPTGARMNETRASEAGSDASDATLRAERDALARERVAFEKERREWRESREPLDS